MNKPHLTRGLGGIPRALLRSDKREVDDESLDTRERQLKRKTHRSLVEHRRKRAKQLKSSNQDLEALLYRGVRAVTAHALRHGVSARLGSGEPHRTAVSQGAMLVAQVMHREGVQAAELDSLLALWRRRVDSADLFTAAEQLLGRGFKKLTYPRGTPLADFCEVLFGSATEVGDLFAAGGIVNSVQRKLELVENKSRPVASAATRKKGPGLRKKKKGGA